MCKNLSGAEIANEEVHTIAPVYVGGDGMHSEPDDWFCADGREKE